MKPNTNQRLSILVKTAVLAALAFIIFLLPISIPIFPGFLTFDFSEIPAIFAALAYGPVSAIAVELVKNLLHLFMSTTAGVGEFANFLVGCFFVVPLGLIYKRYKNRKGAFIGLGVSTISMVVLASLANYFLILKLYELIAGYPLQAVIGMSQAANSGITDKFSLILYAFVPFNLLKGLVISLITIVIYKRLSPLLHKNLF